MIKLIQENLHQTINNFWKTLAGLVERGKTLQELELSIHDIEANSRQFVQERKCPCETCWNLYEYFCCFFCNRNRVKRALKGK